MNYSKEYEIDLIILNTKENIKHPDPFTFVWKIPTLNDTIPVPKSFMDEFEKRKAAIKQRAAKEMLELYKDTKAAILREKE